ncbi:hypothetical protein KY289_010476 [Solanum tuberosum]|nr:hypothetical protein KY289_010476 [Solanum tuberosum]
MGKKRKSLASSLDEVDRTMYSTFCSAANSLSQLYTQAMNQQKLSFLSGERHGMFWGEVWKNNSRISVPTELEVVISRMLWRDSLIQGYWSLEEIEEFLCRCMSGLQEIFCDGDRKEAGKKYGIPKAPEEELYFDWFVV